MHAKLMRFERVFVDSLRTSVAAGSLLDGQRLEAAKILARVARDHGLSADRGGAR